MNSIVEDILMHYGMPRRSGRYPYGSGENPYQHSGDFLSRVQELKKSGMSETDIAKNMGLTTTQLRTQMSLAKDERRALQVATAKGLREKGYSLNEIADKMGFANDSSVRSLLNETSENRMNQANIEITDKEWEAIQAGAISENKLTQILNNTNADTIRQRATPRASTALSTAKQNRIAALSASGYSTSEIAEALGVSSSTVSKYLNGKE